MIEETSVERLEVALARAIADGAVVHFDTLPQLLSQLPEHLRVAVSRAFDAYRPFDEGAGFFVAHLKLDPDGRWGVARCRGHQVGYWLIVSCGQARYDTAIQLIRDMGRMQRESMPWN